MRAKKWREEKTTNRERIDETTISSEIHLTHPSTPTFGDDYLKGLIDTMM